MAKHSQISETQIEWNFEAIKGDFESKHKKWMEKTDAFVNKWKGKEDYLKDPKILKQALDEYETWWTHYGTDSDELYYTWLRTAQDLNNPKLKADFNKAEELSKNVWNDVQFFELNIGKIPVKDQSKFLSYAPLKKYLHFLEKIFVNSKYMLSESEERIMNLKQTSSHTSWVKMVSGFTSKEERVVLDDDGKKTTKPFNSIFSLLQNSDKKIRDAAGKAINDILSKHVDLAEIEINAIMGNKKVNDELRHIDRPDRSRHIADDIDSDTVDTLVKSVSNNFSVSKRFYKIKSKLLGLPRLEYHERNVRYGKVNTKYSFKDSIELVSKVFGKLDKEFVNILNSFVKNGQIDVFPRKGKKGGAFCVYMLKTQPVYVLLNHTDTIRSVTTLAHEMGHAINNEFMRKLNSLDFGSSLATAEVASTFMEDFVLEELMKSADDETRLSLMVEKLDADIATIHRQVACYTFEQELHKEFRKAGYLSKEEIGKLFQKHMSAYMGPSVEQSKGSENWWVYWGQIRRFFYNYSYANGLLISKALQRLVRENPKNIEKVKRFISTGLSKSPKDTFAECGLDITKKEFWETGLKEVEDLLDETEALAKKLGKL